MPIAKRGAAAPKQPAGKATPAVSKPQKGLAFADMLQSAQKESALSFNLDELEFTPSNNGNCKVTGEFTNGKSFHFWTHAWDEKNNLVPVYEDIFTDNGDGTGTLNPGVRVGRDGGIYHN